MKWFTICYLLLSFALALFIVYVLIANMVNYGFEDAEMFLTYMKIFLCYVLLNIGFLLTIVWSYYKKMYF